MFWISWMLTQSSCPNPQRIRNRSPECFTTRPWYQECVWFWHWLKPGTSWFGQCCPNQYILVCFRPKSWQSRGLFYWAPISITIMVGCLPAGFFWSSILYPKLNSDQGCRSKGQHKLHGRVLSTQWRRPNIELTLTSTFLHQWVLGLGHWLEFSLAFLEADWDPASRGSVCRQHDPTLQPLAGGGVPTRLWGH